MSPSAQECRNSVPAGDPLADSCTGHNRTLGVVMPNGAALVIGQGRTAQIYKSGSEQWIPVASAAFPRSNRNAIMMVLSGPRCGSRCGKVLLAGGNLGFNSLSQVFNPVTNVWEDPASPALDILDPTATLLTGPRCGDKCGQILVVGNALDPLTQLYDPKENVWSTGPPMIRGRSLHSAALLADGRVLVAGGSQADQSIGDGSGDVSPEGVFPRWRNRSAEIYDPQDNLWRPTAEMRFDRMQAPAVLLKEPGCGNHCGKVLISGGQSNNGGPIEASAELYNPSTGLWETTASMNDGRQLHSAVQLASGKVLVAGGQNYSGSPNDMSVDLYDPISEPPRWTPLSPTNSPHADLPNLLLPAGPVGLCGQNCGKFLAVGGNGGLEVAELFRPPVEIGGLDPKRGPTTGGTEVSIVGTSFAKVKSVTFGSTTISCGQPQQSQCWADADSPATKIIAISPPNPQGQVHVRVTAEVEKPDGGLEVRTSPATVNDLFDYFTEPLSPVLPVVTGIDPDCGTEGTPVKIEGTALGGATEVRFGETSVARDRLQLSSDSQITAPAPGIAGAVVVRVVTAAGISTPSAQTFTSPCGSITAPPPPDIRPEPPPGTVVQPQPPATVVPQTPSSPPGAGASAVSTPVTPSGASGSPASLPAVTAVQAPVSGTVSAQQGATVAQGIDTGLANAGAAVPGAQTVAEPARRHAMVRLGSESITLALGAGGLLIGAWSLRRREGSCREQQPAVCPAIAR